MMSFEEICVKFVGMDTYAGIFFCWETYAGNWEGEKQLCLLNLINHDYMDHLVLRPC